MAGRGVNKVTLIGHLGADPEQRRTQSGSLVVNLSVATNETWVDGETKERKERTEWHRVVVFGRTAEFLAQYAKKGSLVYVEGRLQTRKWQDPRTGQDKYTTEIIGRDLNLLDSRPDSRPGDYSSQQGSDYSQSSSSESESSAGSSAISDDPIDDMPW